MKVTIESLKFLECHYATLCFKTRSDCPHPILHEHSYHQETHQCMLWIPWVVFWGVTGPEKISFVCMYFGYSHHACACGRLHLCDSHDLSSPKIGEVKSHKYTHSHSPLGKLCKWNGCVNAQHTYGGHLPYVCCNGTTFFSSLFQFSSYLEKKNCSFSGGRREL